MGCRICLAAACLLVWSGASAGQRDRVQTELFEAGTKGYHTFRIPSLLVTTKGSILAFCEARKDGSRDSGDIDLAMRRSTDNGATWSPIRVIADDGPNTLGNPCPVVDRDTGTIWMLLTGNLGEDTEPQILRGTGRGTRTVWVMNSTDDGLTWSPPVEITRTTKAPDWTWYATGPGVGIQLRSGRLVIPCDHYLAGSKGRESHVIYSDDHGATWRLGGSIRPDVNECQFVERADGSLLINMRSYSATEPKMRALSTSADGGLTWSAVSYDRTLVEPTCQASLLRYPGADGKRLLFSNPASTKRERMTVRLSTDDGKTWPFAKVLNEGPSAYSCLAVLADRTVACLYERGERGPYQRITLARFPLDWLMGRE